MATARLSFLVFIAILTESAGVLPPYLPALNLNNQPVQRDILIEQDFSTGLGYDEIFFFFGLATQYNVKHPPAEANITCSWS